ncbi:hypothetical protein SDC9_71149 [bioreactor metagenome]|uniref:Uncharacterized protein n=1 Tax=bioreactor metagenome TaxID=1076179 RepID=A0A644Y7X9_9ZZZZ
MEKGLYKKVNESEMIFAKNEINYPDGTNIQVADYVAATSEIYDGWYWFNTRDEAKVALGVTDPELPKINELWPAK